MNTFPANNAFISPQIGVSTITCRDSSGHFASTTGYTGNGVMLTTGWSSEEFSISSANINMDKGVIECWSTSSGHGLFYSSGPSTTNAYTFVGSNPPYPLEFFIDGAHVQTDAQTNWFTKPFGSWYNYRFVWDRLAGVLEIWVDGVKRSSNITGTWAPATIDRFTIMGKVGRTYGFSTGRALDEFYISYITSAPVNVRDYTAVPGTNPGTVNLTWTTPGDDGTGNDLIAGSRFAIQYNTVEATAWSYSSANLVLSTAVTAGITANYTITGLTRGTTYFFRIWTADEMGNWSTICEPGATTYAQNDVLVPNPITDLTATSGTNSGEINLSWTSTGDDGDSGAFDTGSVFNLMVSSWVNTSNIAAFYASTRSVSIYSPVPTPSTAKTVINITVTGLSAGTSYWFAIRTVDEQPNISLLSNGATGFATMDNTPPSAITDLTGLQGSAENTITLSWTSPGDDGLLNDFAGGGSFDIRFTSGAIGSIGDTNSPARTNANFNSAISISSFSPIPIPGTAFIRRTMTLTGLQPGVTYYFAMKTKDEVLNPSGLSNGCTVWAMTDIVSPSSVTLTSAGIFTSSITLRWNSPGDNGTTGNITNGFFWVKYTTYTDVIDDASFVSANYQVVLPTSSAYNQQHTYALTGLLSDLTYYIAFKTADESVNWSPISSQLVAKTLDTTTPNSITTLSALPGDNEGEIKLTWSAPGDDGTNNALYLGSNYYIQVSSEASVSWAIGNAQVVMSTDSVIPNTKETFVLTGLTPGTTHFFRIWTRDEWQNQSGISNSATTYVQIDIVPPAAVTDLSGYQTFQTQITLNWTATGDDGYSGSFSTGAAFDIRFSSTAGQSPSVSTTTFAAAQSVNSYCAIPLATTTQWQYSTNLTGLEIGATYYFSIKTRDERGNISLLSNGCTVWSYGDTTAPGAVTDLAAAPGATQEGTINLSWTSTGNDGYTKDFPGGCAFDIKYSTINSLSPALNDTNFTNARSLMDFYNPIPSPGTATTKYALTLTGLRGGVTYYFAIKTQDEASNPSALSKGATSWAQLDVTFPSDITDLSYSSLGNTYIELVWTAPGDNGTEGTTASYIIKYSTNEITALNFNSTNDPAETEPAPSAVNTRQSLTISGLQEKTTYWFAIKAFDEQGNYTQLYSTYVLNIRTQDFTKPFIVSAWPADKSIGVSLSTKPYITMSEEINVNFIDAYITMEAVKDNLGNTVSVPVSMDPAVWYNADKKIELSPQASLSGNYTYKVTISTGIRDKSSLRMAMPYYEYTFSTVLSKADANVIYSPDNRVKLNIAANILTADGYILISTDALHNPMHVTPSVITTANNKILSGEDKYANVVEDTIIEVAMYDTNQVLQNPVFTSGVTLTIPYRDANSDGIVDGTPVPMKESTLYPYYLNESGALWEKQIRNAGDIDTVNNTLSFNVGHFSVYCLTGGEDTDLSDAIAFPVPFKASRGDTEITFKYLSSVATIKVYNLLGELVKTIEESDGDGTARWNATNESGGKLGSGLYFYYISNRHETKQGKLLIVK
ncbi:MAG: hypothetical protein A3J83_05965 [Elusimicrobia bacterium RIFOXYA2_FULL_40_6]|nr:MAG: hypothetical protein A3J83_05965 [Elusimicrobia bacterium RIFOXYA2_FULL_40_6]